MRDVAADRLSLFINIHIKCLNSKKDEQTDIITLTVNINDKLDKMMQTILTYGLVGSIVFQNYLLS